MFSELRPNVSTNIANISCFSGTFLCSCCVFTRRNIKNLFELQTIQNSIKFPSISRPGCFLLKRFLSCVLSFIICEKFSSLKVPNKTVVMFFPMSHHVFSFKKILCYAPPLCINPLLCYIMCFSYKFSSLCPPVAYYPLLCYIMFFLSFLCYIPLLRINPLLCYIMFFS